MKNILLIMAFAMVSYILYSQEDKQVKDSTLTKTQIIVNMPEILSIKNLNDKTANAFFNEKNMPWVVALIIGFVSAGVNFYIAKRNEKNLKVQQDNANKLAERQFKLQLATTVDKEWVFALRDSISQLITVTDPDYNNGLDTQKMLYLINKVQIMLDDSNKDENNLNAAITSLGMACTYDRDIHEKEHILRLQDAVIQNIRIVIRNKTRSSTIHNS